VAQAILVRSEVQELREEGQATFLQAAEEGPPEHLILGVTNV
jgi:hypothetical protein